jgi:hypothetical protein
MSTDKQPVFLPKNASKSACEVERSVDFRNQQRLVTLPEFLQPDYRH